MSLFQSHQANDLKNQFNNASPSEKDDRSGLCDQIQDFVLSAGKCAVATPFGGKVSEEKQPDPIETGEGGRQVMVFDQAKTLALYQTCMVGPLSQEQRKAIDKKVFANC